MKQFQDLINKFLNGFEIDGKTENFELHNIELRTDTDGIDYISLQIGDHLPKLVLDEIKEMGYEIYHVSAGGLSIKEGNIGIGFYKADNNE